MAWEGTKVFTKYDKYNYQDLIRENFNLGFLLEELNKYGYYPKNLVVLRTDYTVVDFPTVTTLNNTRTNLVSFVQSSFQPPTAPVLVVNPLRKQAFDYNSANAIEKNTQGLYDALLQIPLGYKRAGTFASGQEVVL